MTLLDYTVLAIVDKLLIAVLVLIVGYWLNQRLEALRGSLAFQTALAPTRTTAYETLWEKTEQLTPHNLTALNVDEAKGSCLEDLRNWYYEKGNAMYLSLDAADLLLEGFNLLKRTKVSAEEIQNHFSSLRTQLKVDLGIYTTADAKVQIPRTS